MAVTAAAVAAGGTAVEYMLTTIETAVAAAAVAPQGATYGVHLGGFNFGSLIQKGPKNFPALQTRVPLMGDHRGPFMGGVVEAEGREKEQNPYILSLPTPPIEWGGSV